LTKLLFAILLIPTEEEPKIDADSTTAETICPRCKMSSRTDAEYCHHCGARVGEHKPIPWWHLHRRLYDWTLGWAYRPSSSAALFTLSFAESSFFPIPPDVLLMPLTLGNRRKWFHYALLCSLASVLGGIAGYLIGFGAWAAISEHVFRWFHWAGFTPEKFEEVSEAYDEWNFWVVFTAGFTPLPFKLITITAGVFKINFAVFLVAAAVSRSGRFFLVAGLMRAFGAKITPFIDKYFNWLALLFAVLLVGGFVVAKYL
jgi:membrane protein YqaA with SNARE-associated domain